MHGGGKWSANGLRLTAHGRLNQMEGGAIFTNQPMVMKEETTVSIRGLFRILNPPPLARWALSSPQSAMFSRGPFS